MAEAVNEIDVSLTLTSKRYLPEEVTALTGLQPTKAWRINQAIEGTLRFYEWNGWSLASELDSRASLDEHIAALLSVIETVPGLQELSSRWEVELSCAIYAKAYVPPCHFDRETIRRLASIGAHIDIDIYCLEGGL